MAVLKASTRMRSTGNPNVGGDGGVRLEITNWNEVMKVLVKLDKTYVKELRTSFREIAKPVQAEVKKAIPSKAKPPLSGMKQVHFGRLAWGSSYGKGAKPSKSVLIQTPNVRSRKYKNVDIAIARLLVQSPATVLADMAGRANNTKARRGMSVEYDYMYTINGTKVPGRRKHRVSPYNFLGSMSQAESTLKNSASRFIWPAAEKALPKARAQIDAKISEANIKVNALLRMK